MKITSTHNALIKEAVLLREAKSRREHGLAIIDGARELLRAQKSGLLINQVFYCPSLMPEGVDIKIFKSDKMVELSAAAFSKIAYGDRQDGIVGIVAIKQQTLHHIRLSKNPIVVVLESVEKPGNLGAVLRTCDAVGADALIVCDPKVDLYNSNVIRSSTGAIFSVPTVSASNADTVSFLKKNNIGLVGAFPQAKVVYTSASLAGPVALVLGAEDRGLSEFWQQHCTTKVRIPMHGSVDSLNVSVTAALMAYEALRQRQSK